MTGVDEAGWIDFVFGVDVISIKNSNWSWLSIGKRSLNISIDQREKYEGYISTLTFCYFRCLLAFYIWISICFFDFLYESERLKENKNQMNEHDCSHVFSFALSLCLASSLLCIIICSPLIHSLHWSMPIMFHTLPQSRFNELICRPSAGRHRSFDFMMYIQAALIRKSNVYEIQSRTKMHYITLIYL